jgi:tetratricopeptide (TPR) repeat protein
MMNSKLAFILAFLLFASIASAGELNGIQKNNSGVEKFKQNKPVDAYNDFSQSLSDLPFRPEVHFNLGTAFLVNKEFDKAISEFDQTERLAKGDSNEAKAMRFRALYNKAVALSELKKVPEALDSYQAALELNPDSLETKTNIELLTKNGGEGQGESDDQKPSDGKDKKDGQGNQQQPNQPPKPENGQQKPQPKPFKSEQLSKQDVGRILDELKRQEEQIRAKMEHQNSKDAPPDKDW